jgi:hypothetical protein
MSTGLAVTEESCLKWQFTFGGRDIKVVDVSLYICFCECRIMIERIKNVKFPSFGISGDELLFRLHPVPLFALRSLICLNVLFFNLRRIDPAFSIPRNLSCCSKSISDVLTGVPEGGRNCQHHWWNIHEITPVHFLSKFDLPDTSHLLSPTSSNTALVFPPAFRIE